MSRLLRRHVLTDNAVPKDAFEGAKGVIFLQAAAAAVGLTAFRGQGFIIARVDGAWSAPAFIRLATMGMGLSLGGALSIPPRPESDYFSKSSTVSDICWHGA